MRPCCSACSCSAPNYGRIAARHGRKPRHGRGARRQCRSVFALVFTLGSLLGTVGGALVVPTSAASLDMAIEFVVEAFAVVVIGGLGSMRGALSARCWSD